MGGGTGSEYHAEDFARSRHGSGGQRSWQASESGPEKWPFSASLSMTFSPTIIEETRD